MIADPSPDAATPGHVPAHLVRDFDFYNFAGDGDIHAAYVAVRETSPELFWTPRNGGHWVATNGADILHMFRDPAHFSSEHVTLPPAPPEAPRIVPMEMDPPKSSPYRQPLIQAMMPNNVTALETEIRAVAIETIERLKPLGECEFITDFAKVLPIHIFFRLVELPLADKPFLVELAETGTRDPDAHARTEARRQMREYLLSWVQARRASPGDDLLSKIVNVDLGGERISEDEAVNYASTVLFGGLDTVASMLGFFARFLAGNAAIRKLLIERRDDDAFIMRAVDELLRRHSVANVGRFLKEDFTYKGVEFRAGDRILPATPFVGLDDKLNPDPLVVDFDRVRPSMAVFGNGPHSCPGANLARRELKVFLQEWLPRIPDFSVKPGTQPVVTTAIINSVLRLELVWPH